MKKKLDLYGVSLLESLIVDRFKYRGKGRPRKSDYSPVWEIQKKINQALNEYLDVTSQIRP